MDYELISQLFSNALNIVINCLVFKCNVSGGKNMKLIIEDEKISNIIKIKNKNINIIYTIFNNI